MSDHPSHAKADLHCHSHASGPNGNWWYAQFDMPDCDTPPSEVYARAKANGMDFVTLTDHDTIDGALELAHHDDFIIGEEVTAHFADDGKRLDVVVLGLDGLQHVEIQARRDDVHSLVRYLASQRLIHFLAHPIYDPANAVEPSHIERLAALFPLWETRNGARICEANELAARLHQTPGDLRATQLHSPDWQVAGQVGGSDDHGGTDVGTTYTITPPASTATEFLAHLRAGRCAPAGLHAEPARIAHMVLRLIDRRLGNGADSARLLAWDAVSKGDLTHRQLSRLAEELAVSCPEAQDNGLLGALKQLAGYAQAQLRLAPYVAVGAYLARERDGARQLAKRLGVGRAGRPGRVAVLADGLSSVNGVSEVYRSMLPLVEGIDVTVVSFDEFPELAGVTLRRAATIELPVYRDLDLPLPHLSELSERLFDMQPDAIHVAGPGPLGLAGMAMARLLRLPLIASYHTELEQYATRLTDDPIAGEFTHALASRFYRCADVVIVPTPTAASMVTRRLGVPADRVRLVPQGVDSHRFSPPATAPMNPTPRILCVSRISGEKDIGMLIDAVELVRSTVEVELVLVGDGPARASLEARSALRHTQFRGWLAGHDLAAAYQSADIFVLPSGTETCGQVLLEAQACGLPTIVSPLGAARDAIIDKNTGIVTSDHSPVALADAILELLNDRTRHHRMRASARSHAKMLTWTDAALALTNVYEALCEPPPASQALRESPYGRPAEDVRDLSSTEIDALLSSVLEPQ